MKKVSNSCDCSAGNKLVLSCSGAADLGLLSDQVARKLSFNNIRKMNCLAVVASEKEEMLGKFRISDILVIDGCSEDCGRKIMSQKRLTDFKHLRLNDLGYEKGKTPVNAEIIDKIYEIAAAF